MRRCVAVLVLVLATLGALGSTQANAGEPSTTSTTIGDAPPAPDIIPEPDSGSAPEDPGDRGGVLQTVLFVAVLGGIGGIGYLVVRESRRARANRGF
ncbi:MAG: hypothetical protein U5K30_03220 [Acidimicrobiales bacterium]|nr:hypothetical protein [Acidimicrobiales bacterium]